MAAQSLPEPSSSQLIRNYDVFLSTGTDTRKNFTDHLRNALIKAEINIFIDDEELDRGNEITSSLLKAIEESRISIVVFSEGYASSTWCFDQLVKIMECKKSIGQTVIPIYYHVHPSDVRNQISTFANAFAWHEDDTELERKRKWRAALEEAGNLFGFDFANGFEAKLIEQIVEEISKKVKLPIVQSFPGPPSSQPIREYDVILNYRGSDTRMNFTDHLYTALKGARICTFIDDEGLERGMEIFPKMLKAIEISRISIVVFSKGYAYSTWCLDELVKILDLKILDCKNRKRRIIPIYYDVDPLEVEHQNLSFANAFAQHERWVDVERVQKWREALRKAVTFSGHVTTGRFASKLIEEIVKRISEEIKPPLGLVDGDANGRRIGNLFVSNKKIAKGSNGTIVFEGRYQGRQVAVKRLVQSHNDVASKEINNLIASDRHPNIVRYCGVESDEYFVYLSLELCTCSLDDLIQIYSDCSQNPVFREIEYKTHLESVKHIMPNLNLWKANGHPSPLLLKVMRDVVSGLVHLHELRIIHRDLKPQNVLIIKEESLHAKLSDMGISKRLLEDMTSLGHLATGCGSSGWQAPEQLLHGRQTRAVDLYSLGCVLFFCITRGRHPFGNRFERDSNIVKSQKDLSLVEHIPEAENLISCLLNPDPDLRPKALEVLHHPLFWRSKKRLDFLCDTSAMVRKEINRVREEIKGVQEEIKRVQEEIARESDSKVLKALESDSELLKALESGSELLKALETLKSVSELLKALESGSKLLKALESGSKLLKALGSGSELLKALESGSKLLKELESGSELLKALDNRNSALGAEWNTKIDKAFTEEKKKEEEESSVLNPKKNKRKKSINYKPYDFNSIADLLRVIRNKWTHYEDLPDDDVKKLFGSVPKGEAAAASPTKELLGSLAEEFDGYFASRFPKLFIEVYKVVSRYCRDEERFPKLQEYFKINVD